MEADFQQYYGLDISTVDLCRASRLLFQLPVSGRVITTLNPKAQWGWQEFLANKTNFLLEMIVWQNATPTKPKDKAKHKAEKPKPFIPDFMKEPEPPSAINEDSVAMLPHEIEQWLSLPRT